jgi:hypothetical protein
MFSASVLKHIPENILKFNVSGGKFLSLGLIIVKNMAASYFGKNYLTVFPQKLDLCMKVLCDRGICLELDDSMHVYETKLATVHSHFIYQ